MVNQRVGGSATPTPKSRASGTTGGQTGQVTQQVSDTARETVSKATETAKQQADTQLNRLSGGLERIAETLHETSGNLRQQDQGMVAGYVEKAASQVERASDYLRVSTANDIIEDVQSYARREPVVAIGVAVGVGFLAARLLKASMRSGTPGGSGQTLRYQTRAYSTSRTNPSLESQYAVPGVTTNRYGNGA
jgi:ElaB/YqjD/DUF883 family membrane-anchored ribosome-binding protein